MCYISIVSPVYMADSIVDELVLRITDSLSKISNDFEIILVEDGGRDKSWQKIEENCQKDTRIKGIKLSRNFGQHYAITAGLENAKGEYVIVLDCDLQDDPIYFQDLINKAREGYDVVFARRNVRKHSWIKNLYAGLFYNILNFLVQDDISKGSGQIGTYSLLTRKVVQAYHMVGDYRRHYIMVIRWLGFNYAFVEIEHAERYKGYSSYDMRKLIRLALDGMTAQSTRLLNLMTVFGFFLSFLSFIAGLTLIIRYLYKPFQAGWTSIFVLILFVGGIIILCIGICGIYVGRIFDQTKRRPLYIIDTKINT